MFKNQGFIYLTRCHLAQAPLIKVNYYQAQTLPTGFSENHHALAVWPLSSSSDSVQPILDQLHAGLIRAGLAFTIPKVYQANLTQMIRFIDSWLEVDRHFEGTPNQIEDGFDSDFIPLHSKFISEDSINLLQLGHAWLAQEEAYEFCAASAFYRGMIHGQTNCQIELAKCYEQGVGVETDYSRARELLGAIKNTETYPLLLRLSYLENKKDLIKHTCDEFFSSSPLPIPGKGSVNYLFHNALLDMLWVSYEQSGHLDFWLNSWELVSPYREELLTLCEVRVMDSLESPEASQTRHFHDILSQTFQVYRQTA